MSTIDFTKGHNMVLTGLAQWAKITEASGPSDFSKKYQLNLILAKESIDENKMPVSETLAKIFALQGNYPKSIYVYEQLILIFPEKKSFFATQIKNLKKKLNS